MYMTETEIATINEEFRALAEKSTIDQLNALKFILNHDQLLDQLWALDKSDKSQLQGFSDHVAELMGKEKAASDAPTPKAVCTE